jgi:YVTN family beta-propeller protein
MSISSRTRILLSVVLLAGTLGWSAGADVLLPSIPVGNGPLAVAVSPPGDRLYVTELNGGSTNLRVLKTDGTFVANVALGGGGSELAVSPDNTRVYFANTSLNSVQVVSTATLTVIGTIGVGPSPIGVTFDPSGAHAYVTNYYGPSLSIIDVTLGTVVNTIALHEGPRGVRAINVPGVGLRVYVALAGGANNEVAVVNPATSSVSYIPVSGGPFFLDATPDRSKVFVSLSTGNQTAAIGTATNTVQAYITDVGGWPFEVAVAATPTGNRVFVTDFNGNGIGYDVTRIDAATNTFLGQVGVGQQPRGIAAKPDGTRVFVVAFGANKINVIDTTH